VLDQLGEFALHAEGHALLLCVRGRLFHLPGLWEGPAVPLGATHGARCVSRPKPQRPRVVTMHGTRDVVTGTTEASS
jgi:hypothetical protein